MLSILFLGLPSFNESNTTIVSAPITNDFSFDLDMSRAFSLAQCSANASGGSRNLKSSLTLLGKIEKSIFIILRIFSLLGDLDARIFIFSFLMLVNGI